MNSLEAAMKMKFRLLIFASSLILTGCGNQYWTRNDTIYSHTGDAVRSNIAVQVPDPWPKKSENTNIPMDPVKAQYAVNCYRLGRPPSDSLGAGNWGYKAGSGGGGAQSGASTTCQETGAKAVAPEGTTNSNVSSSSNYNVDSVSGGGDGNNAPQTTIPLK